MSRRHHVLLSAFVTSAVAARPAPAGAQYEAAVVAGAVRHSAVLTPADQVAIARASIGAEVDRRSRVVSSALLGGTAGAVVGLAAAFIVTHGGTYADHSEDSLVYIQFVPSGALLGAVVGGVVGAIERD